MNDRYVSSLIASGDLVRANKRSQKLVNDIDRNGNLTGEQGEMDHYTEKLFDICKKCKALATIRPGDVEFERERRIQQRYRRLRESRPDLDFAARVHAAVEEEFDPINEPNPEFRKFLLERRGL